MSQVKVSVIIPTRNRPEKLEAILSCLRRQNCLAGKYEIIVVDDGSTPPISLLPVIASGDAIEPACRLVRLEGVERSAARNAGAAAAAGDLLVFVDDDIAVGPDFLASHLIAHDEWPGALAVGDIRLPADALAKPFVRFRQKLEQQGVPRRRGVVAIRNFCAAANMSLSRVCFQKLGGFDRRIASSEDQDLALRHTASGGRIIYLPEAQAIHFDSALDIRSYCRRSEWGIEQMIPFCQRYPEWPQNLDRERVNGTAHVEGDNPAKALRKAVKSILALNAVTEILFIIASLLEWLIPNSAALDRVYRLLLGAHIFRGYRRGLLRYGIVAGASPHLTEQTMTAPSNQEA